MNVREALSNVDGAVESIKDYFFDLDMDMIYLLLLIMGFLFYLYKKWDE